MKLPTLEEIKDAILASAKDNPYGISTVQAKAAAVMQLLQSKQDYATRVTPSDNALFELYLGSGAGELGIRAVREAVAAPLRAEIERLTECLNNEYESNQIRNQHDLEVKEELQTALGEKFDPGVMTFRLIRDLARERDGYRIRLTKTVDKYDHFIAECDTLRAKLAAAEGERDDWKKQYKGLLDLSRREIDALKAEKTTTRPVRVRFDVTPEDACEAVELEVDDEIHMRNTMDYLSAHAVIDVPEGVPSAEDAVETAYNARYGAQEREWKTAESYSKDAWSKVGDSILALFAPYLQPATAVDAPEPIAAAETLEQLAEIAWEANRLKYNEVSNDIRFKWDSIRDNEKEATRAEVTAVLRAAKPVIDMTVAEWAEIVGYDAAVDMANKLNSRIRYRFDLPPTDSETNDMLTAAYMSGRYDSKDDLRRQQRERYHEVYMALVRQGIDGAHKYAVKAAVAYPRHLTELDAALDGKDSK